MSKNLVVYGNSGAYGAGIYIQNSHSSLQRLTVCHNTGNGVRIAANSPVRLENSIVYYNTGNFTCSDMLAVLTFNNIQNATEGFGNISLDPMFVNHEENNYTLQTASPCLNQGSPFANADPDGTRSDMGALFLPNDAATIYVDFVADQTSIINSNPASVLFTSAFIPFNCTPESMQWTFGDGATANTANAEHMYAPGGYYTVSLFITSAQGVTYPCIKPRYITFYKHITNDVLSGTLTSAHSPYYIDSVISDVLQGSSLIIEPGTDIFLANNATLVISGSITAQGTEADSIHIQAFDPTLGNAGTLSISNALSAQFAYCHFKNLSHIDNYSNFDAEMVVFDHCIIEDCQMSGILCFGGPIQISNCIIRHNGTVGSAVQVYNSNSIIENNQIYNNFGNAVFIPDNMEVTDRIVRISGNTLTNTSSTYPTLYLGINNRAIINGNTISNGRAGIWMENGSSAIVTSNVVYGVPGWGIYCDSLSTQNTTYIQGNLIRNNREDGICMYYSNPVISNNTIVNNNVGGAENTGGIWWAFDCPAQIVNNIIRGNRKDIWSNDITGTSPTVSDNIHQFALNPVLTDNGNNLIADPLFVSAADYRITADSPATDTGNMGYAYIANLEFDLSGFPRLYDGDDDGSAVIDRGCYEYNPNAAEEDFSSPAIHSFALSAFPNPFSSATNLHFTLDKTTRIQLDIYNVKGQLVRTLLDSSLQKGSHAIAWDALDQNRKPVGTGIYFYRLCSGKQAKSGKLMYIR